MTKLIWLAVGLMSVLGPPLAFADLLLQFSFDGATITIDGTTQTVTASGGASTSGSTISFVSGIDVFSGLVVSPTGTSGGFLLGGVFVNSNSPAGGCCTFPLFTIDTGSIFNQSGATGTLTITTGDTGFTLPSENPTTPATLASNISALTANTNGSNATVGSTSFLDTTNAQFGTQQNLFSVGMNIGVGLGQTSFNTAPVILGTTPFSLTNIFTITLANGDSAIFDSSTKVTTVPEPATVLLLGSGIAGLAAWRSRKLAL